MARAKIFYYRTLLGVTWYLLWSANILSLFAFTNFSLLISKVEAFAVVDCRNVERTKGEFRLDSPVVGPIVNDRPCSISKGTAEKGMSSRRNSQLRMGEKIFVSEDFYIRESKYKDLKDVSEIIVKAFYKSSDSPWRHLYVLAELNRLQQNFPYDKEKHSMFVAISQETNAIVGFCDVDGRPSTMRDAPPRPYLSDLAVDVDWRRRGIARALIGMGELKAEQMGHDVLYIRVERENEVALRMYSGLQYEAQTHEVFGVRDNTILLKRNLAARDASLCDAVRSTGVVEGGNRTASMTVLDFMV